MEPQFGHDFSHIRVHTDERAAASARAVRASAYTVQHDIVFDAGRYAPGTSSGRELLAHELAHTMQQTRHAWPATGTLRAGAIPRISPPSSLQTLQIGDPYCSAEREADSVAQSTLQPGYSGPHFGHSAPLIQRQPNPGALQSRPEDFGITLAVADNGASGVKADAQARLEEIYRSLNPTNLLQLQKMGVTRIELDVIPYDKKIIDLPAFAKLKGQKTHDGRLWDDVRGEGGIRDGSTIRYAVGEEGLAGGRHGHGLAIGLGILFGAGGGAGGAGLGAELGGDVAKKFSLNTRTGGIVGGILGGVAGAALGAIGGALLGNLSDRSSGYAKGFAASHEGTHTVENALSPAQHTSLQQLYDARLKAGGPWLEPADYTKSTIHEYFANCSAAFFSHPYEDEYAKSYNPEWLHQNDPGMFQLLTEVFGPHGTPKPPVKNDMLDMRYRATAVG